MIRLGLVGGGPGSFIGGVHRMAAELDHEFVMVAGAFSSDADRSREAAKDYGIDVERGYPSIDEMIAREGKLEDGIQAVAIATPNHLHLPAALAALDAGLGVISDKPPAADLGETRRLAAAVAQANVPYALTFTYCGYPMVREARARVAAGQLGTIRKVVVEYFQGWLADSVESSGQKQASWRVDPNRSGIGGCITDIGTHALNIAEFVTGLEVSEILPDLAAVVPGRLLDDDATVLLRFQGGARGLLAASQIAAGERNNLKLRVYGTAGALQWSHAEADRLIHTSVDGRTETIWCGSPQAGPMAAQITRLPAGHPEGFIEAFSNIYRDFAAAFRGERPASLPSIDVGLRAMMFVDAAVANGRPGGWRPLDVRDLV